MENAGFQNAKFAGKYLEYVLRKLAFLKQRPEFEGSYSLDSFFAGLRKRAPGERSIDFLSYVRAAPTLRPLLSARDC